MKISEKWMGLEKNYIKQDDPDSERHQPCLLIHMIRATLIVCVCVYVFISVVKSERS